MLNQRLQPYGNTVSILYADLHRQEAKAALQTGSESVAEVAQRFGFSDATAIARAFKKRTGVTPSDFR